MNFAPQMCATASGRQALLRPDLPHRRSGAQGGRSCLDEIDGTSAFLIRPCFTVPERKAIQNERQHGNVVEFFGGAGIPWLPAYSDRRPCSSTRLRISSRCRSWPNHFSPYPFSSCVFPIHLLIFKNLQMHPGLQQSPLQVGKEVRIRGSGAPLRFCMSERIRLPPVPILSIVHGLSCAPPAF